MGLSPYLGRRLRMTKQKCVFRRQMFMDSSKNITSDPEDFILFLVVPRYQIASREKAKEVHDSL